MSADAQADLAGLLWVRPGAALPTIVSTRREWAPTLGRGKPAAALPDLLAAVYTLCGGAHRVAAGLAVRAALQIDVEVDTAQRQALRVDTLREHLRRLWLDAARLLPALQAPDPAALRGCPLMQRGHDDPAHSLAWIEQQVLGQPAAEWLAGWSAAPAAFAASWAAAGSTWPARWLHGVHGACNNLQQPVRPLHIQASSLELRRLVRQLRHEPDFALAPTWRGHTVETGCWTRLNDPAAVGGDSPYAELWLRHAARVADIAHLAAPRGEHWLLQGLLTIEEPAAADEPPQAGREGLGWCEMARGLLLHWVRLDAQGRVADCRLIAPTEWNFHPYGAAARVLSQLPPTVDDTLVQLLMGAYDPCVAVRRDRGLEASHA